MWFDEPRRPRNRSKHNPQSGRAPSYFLASSQGVESGRVHFCFTSTAFASRSGSRCGRHSKPALKIGSGERPVSSPPEKSRESSQSLWYSSRRADHRDKSQFRTRCSLVYGSVSFFPGLRLMHSALFPGALKPPMLQVGWRRQSWPSPQGGGEEILASPQRAKPLVLSVARRSTAIRSFRTWTVRASSAKGES
jgi:hypothetical protein